MTSFGEVVQNQLLFGGGGGFGIMKSSAAPMQKYQFFLPKSGLPSSAGS